MDNGHRIPMFAAPYLYWGCSTYERPSRSFTCPDRCCRCVFYTVVYGCGGLISAFPYMTVGDRWFWRGLFPYNFLPIVSEQWLVLLYWTLCFSHRLSFLFCLDTISDIRRLRGNLLKSVHSSQWPQRLWSVELFWCEALTLSSVDTPDSGYSWVFLPNNNICIYMGKNNLKQAYWSIWPYFKFEISSSTRGGRPSVFISVIQLCDPFPPYRRRSVPVPTFISTPTTSRVCVCLI